MILLTPEEIVAAELNGARRFAHDICVYAHKIGLRQKRGPTPNRELYIREALCRAQVKKVDTDLLAPLEKQLQAQLTTVLRTIEEGDETECIRGAAAAYSARLREVHEIRAALKAAGEGK